MEYNQVLNRVNTEVQQHQLANKALQENLDELRLIICSRYVGDQPSYTFL